MNERPPKLVLVPIPPSWKYILKQTAPQELDKVLSIKFYAQVTKRNRDTNELESLKIMQSATEREKALKIKSKLSTDSWTSCNWGVSQLKRNQSQNYTGCTLKFLLQRQREVWAWTTEERKVLHYWLRRWESNFDSWKRLFSFSLLLVCLLICLNEFSSHDIVLHTK